MFKNPFSFKGRIRRTEYCISYIIYIVFGFILDFIEGYFSIIIPEIVQFILLFPALYFLLAQGAKRCHDRGNSGWYQLIPFYIFVMAFGDSEYGPNEYGPNPKNEGNNDEINDIGRLIEE